MMRSALTVFSAKTFWSLFFAFKCRCFAVLFCFATGIDAVAHEQLQSPAFDPLIGYETKRLRVNLRYFKTRWNS